MSVSKRAEFSYFRVAIDQAFLMQRIYFEAVIFVIEASVSTKLKNKYLPYFNNVHIVFSDDFSWGCAVYGRRPHRECHRYTGAQQRWRRDRRWRWLGRRRQRILTRFHDCHATDRDGGEQACFQVRSAGGACRDAPARSGGEKCAGIATALCFSLTVLKAFPHLT